MIFSIYFCVPDISYSKTKYNMILERISKRCFCDVNHVVERRSMTRVHCNCKEMIASEKAWKEIHSIILAVGNDFVRQPCEK